MWIFTKAGFYSAVEDWDDQTKVYVRGRRLDDVKAFAELLEQGNQPPIIETPDRDYPFRVHILKTDLVYALAMTVSRLDYGNFKDKVKEVDPDRIPALMSVWSAMHRIEEPRPKVADDKQFALFDTSYAATYTTPRSGDPRGELRVYGREECACGRELVRGDCPDCDWTDLDEYGSFNPPFITGGTK